MKVFISFLFLSLFCTTSLFAQDESISIPDSLDGWKTTWDVRLSGSQASYSNWSQGGTSNIAAASRSIFTTIRKLNRFSYAFRLDTRYGGARLSGEGLRKTDDRLFVTNRFLYDVRRDDSQFKFFSNLTMRTQFDKGYDYGGNEDGTDRLISRFMAPGIFNQNMGLAYVPNKTFSVEAGVGLQQKYVRDITLRPNFGLEPDDPIRSEAGFNFGSSLEFEIGTNVEFKSDINTFTNIKESVRSTDIYFSSKLDGKINNYMNASINFDIIYDDDFSSQAQIAQVVSLGVSYNLR
jgi:hypothetical protein